MIIAAEMSSPLRLTSGPAITHAGDLAAILSGMNDGDVLFVDEIHRMSRPAEEMLYMAMEDFRVDVVIGKGPGATAIPLEIPPFTLVGATTRAGLLPSPLRDRFGFTAHLEFYIRRPRPDRRSSRGCSGHADRRQLAIALPPRDPADREPVAPPGPRLRPVRADGTVTRRSRTARLTYEADQSVSTGRPAALDALPPLRGALWGALHGAVGEEQETVEEVVASRSVGLVVVLPRPGATPRLAAPAAVPSTAAPGGAGVGCRGDLFTDDRRAPARYASDVCPGCAQHHQNGS
jgi:Holliday junction DNA helicase RuvB